MTKLNKPTPVAIDQLLPQTQCNLCGYGGCLPYAQAMVDEAAPINLCPPGGVKTLSLLGAALGVDPTPFQAEMQVKTRLKTVAKVREAECIGCTKCIQACPVDAILGAAKQMHVVIAEDCTGCELCLPACPVDCIDLYLSPPGAEALEEIKVHEARENHQKKLERIRLEQQAKAQSLAQKTLIKRKDYIQEALARARTKISKG